jgi:hypothetical protein
VSFWSSLFSTKHTCCILLKPILNTDETDNTNAEDDKQRDDTSAVPWISCSTPLQGQKEADNGWNEEDSADRIKLKETTLEADRWPGLPRRHTEEQEIDDGSYGSH